MRDATKATIGLGMVWGLFAAGYVLFSSFTIGANDTAPEVIALALYGLTILPSCTLAIWFQRQAGIWLLCLSGIALFGFSYQFVAVRPIHSSAFDIFGSLLWTMVLCTLPALLGCVLLRTSTAPNRETSAVSLDIPR